MSMTFKRIFGPARVDGSSGGGTDYTLPPSAGGSQCKTVQYMLKVVQTDDGVNCLLSVKLNHGPDGTVTKNHSTPIASTAAGTAPNLLVGDADTSKIIGEYLHPILNVVGAGHWATVEVFEMRKPF